MGNANKYDGRIFNIAHSANEDVTLTQMKVDREMQAAISKHGEVQVPKSYEDQFFENIAEKKKNIQTA